MDLEKDGFTRRRLLGLLSMAGVGGMMPVLGEVKKEESIFGVGDVRYDQLRSLFNSDLDKKPKWIAQCNTEADVQRAVRIANDEDLPVAVKSGGHCFIGSSVNNGGMSINLRSLAKKVYLPEQKKLVTGPGVKLGELYDLLLPHGRLLPAGSCAGVGIGGLTLGGGYGLFARQYGLTCDHLTRVRMVTGNGDIIDSNDDIELLWACRGGGNGNFGAITSMEFNTRTAPKNLGAQRLTAKNLNESQMLGLVQKWFEVAGGLPDPIFAALVLNGKQITVLLTSSYPTSGPSFQKAVRLLTKAGFTTRGALNSPIARSLKRYYGRPGPLPFYNVSGGFYKGIESIHCLPDIIHRVQNHSGLIYQVNTLGGEIARGEESAYAHRDYPFLGEIQAYWQRPASRLNLIEQVDAVQSLIGAKQHYRNYPDKNLADASIAYYGENLLKLRELKHRYDPNNRFRHEQSVVGKIS